MSTPIETMADELAREALDLAHRTGDETVPERVADAIGATSPALLKAFAGALELRRAEAHTRAVMREIRSGTSPV